jgi:large subunit ribosomal protein L4
MPHKMRQLAVRSALSAKLRDERVTVIADLAEIQPKTKEMKVVIEKLPASRSILLVTAEKVENIERASGNLENVRTCLASYLNVRDVLKYERLVVSQDALSVIEGLWALPADRREPSSWKLARMAARAEAEKEA